MACGGVWCQHGPSTVRPVRSIRRGGEPQTAFGPASRGAAGGYASLRGPAGSKHFGMGKRTPMPAASPLSTGGAGTIYEYRVAAIVLAALLRGDRVIGLEVPVTEVRPTTSPAIAATSARSPPADPGRGCSRACIPDSPSCPPPSATGWPASASTPSPAAPARSCNSPASSRPPSSPTCSASAPRPPSPGAS